MSPPATDPLREHITRSYLSLRRGIIAIGGALPLVLILLGWYADGHGILGSMSAYYYSPAARNVFVGSLIAIGAILYLYKGFSSREDWALNLAALCVVGVAWVPTTPPETPESLLTWHGAFAVSFFLCIAYVCITCASDTLSLIRDTEKAQALKRTYQTLGAAMVVVPIAAFALGSILNNNSDRNLTVFLVEAAGVWVFAGYWFVKSRELEQTGAAQLALRGKLKVASGKPQVGKLVQVEPDELVVADWSTVAAG